LITLFPYTTLNKNTIEKLKDVPTDRLSEPSPNKLTPLLEGAIQESAPEIQDLWASLMANVMIDGGARVRREFIDTVKQLEPIDAKVLNAIAGMPAPSDWREGNLDINMAYIRDVRNRGILPDDWEVACRSLARLGCIELRHVARIEPFPEMTAFGRQFLNACNVR
jgi:hypothetical protein